MDPVPGTRSSLETVTGASTLLVGGGAVTFALFPLALPALILTAIAAIPLLLPALVLGLLGAVVALPILLVRRLVRGVSRARRATRDNPRRLVGPRPSDVELNQLRPGGPV